MKIRKKIGDLGKEAIEAKVDEFLDELDQGAVAILKHFEEDDNPEFMQVEKDEVGHIVACTYKDGSHYSHNLHSETIDDLDERVSDLEEGGGGGIDNFENINDVEGRTEIVKDSENKIASYRDKNGVLHENTGIVTPEIDVENIRIDDIELSLKAASQISQYMKNGYGSPHLPKNGGVDIKSEVFYLSEDERVSSFNDVCVVQEYEDTDENAKLKIAIASYYVKSSVIDNGDGTYSKYNDGMLDHDIKLDFYAAGKVTKVDDKYYTIASVEEGEPVEVTQITGTPDARTWAVNKSDEHYCVVDIDFGSYFQGTDMVVGVKFQGQSTLKKRKRNFRFKLYKSDAKKYYPLKNGEIDDKFGKKVEIKIGEMLRQSSFNLKANWEDVTRIKELLLNRFFVDVWETRDRNNQYPWNEDNLPYHGVTGLIKAFPVSMNINGDFYGMMVFGYKKDKSNYFLSKDSDGMFVSGQRNDRRSWTDIVGPTVSDTGSPLYYQTPIESWDDEMNDYLTASNTQALIEFYDFINERLCEDESGNYYGQPVEINSGYVEEYGGRYYLKDSLKEDEECWVEVVLRDSKYYIATSVERIATKVGDKYYDDSTLVDGEVVESSVELTPVEINRETLSDRMGLYYWIDYFICLQVFLMNDNSNRNVILYSGPDKHKLYPFFYDLDLAWKTSYPENTDMIAFGRDIELRDMHLWELFIDNFWDEIVNRYCELRNSILNVNYLNTIYMDIANNIPDSYYSNERQRWGVAADDSEFADMISYIGRRLASLDEIYFKV